MRIAVASDDEIRVAAHTGRCRGFVIFEIQGAAPIRKEYRVNAYTGHAQGRCEEGHQQGSHSAHHSHGPLLDALAGCQALISRGMGPRLVGDLSRAGIEAFVCVEEDADEAARQYGQGRLTRLDEAHSCCHHRVSPETA